jgi:hypothetical protein
MTKRYYTIANRISGESLGKYEASTAAEALDAMARDAGYADFDAVPNAAPGEMIVTAVDEIATKEPVTISGWYEHSDGTVGEYSVNNYGPQLGRTVASWADVPSREQDLSDAIAFDRSARR